MFRKGFGGTRGYWNTSPGSITLNAWNYVAVAYNQGNTANDPILYINGVPVAFLEASSPAGAVQSDAANTLVLGNRPGQGRTFAGIIDELRASKTIRSAAWIATEYANQNSPSTFYSVGTAEEGYWKC
jgi:biopolymer transport protein ExbB